MGRREGVRERREGEGREGNKGDWEGGGRG